MDILKPLTLDSKNNLEHESFILERSQTPCSHQKFLKLSSPLSYDLYETYTLLIFLVHANFERKVVEAFVYHKHCKFRGHFFGTNLAGRAMMVSSSRVVELMTQNKALSGDSPNNHLDYLFK
jgi:hypothetical protein